MKRRLTSIILLAWLFVLVPLAAAHGAASEVIIDETSVNVFARFDTGEPMENAQVTIYAPDDPQKSWQTGVADVDGVFQFEIDNTQMGQWSVSVRTAGHGEILYLDVDANGVVSAEITTESPMRTILAVVVVAVLGGIAWYFTRSNKNENTEQKEYARA